MKISEQEKQELEELYQYFFNNEKIQKMKDVQMHRGSDTFTHSFKVAKLSIKRGLRHKKVDLKTLLVGAILHDYYLYDWREDKSKLKRHGKDHPYIATINAIEDFGIDKEVQKVIKSHMWPINLKEFPNTREARIVNLADDTVAFIEAMTSRKFKSKRKEKTLNKLSKLF